MRTLERRLAEMEKRTHRDDARLLRMSADERRRCIKDLMTKLGMTDDREMLARLRQRAMSARR